MNSVLDDDRVFPHQSTSDQYMSQIIYFPNIYKYIFYFTLAAETVV